MTLTVGNFGEQSGNALRLGALEHLRAGILDVLRPELMYPEFFPEASFDRNVARGMTDYSAPIEDWPSRHLSGSGRQVQSLAQTCPHPVYADVWCQEA